MTTPSYIARRGELETYFDHTAVETWKRLTSDAPVGTIRATVRAGRDEMRRELLALLPLDLTGARLLDAGCGTGALAVEAARRGAQVVAIDLSSTLIDLARERSPRGLAGEIDFTVGDMLDRSLGAFDYVVAMDSLIHYEGGDILGALARLADRVSQKILFTVAPRTPALALMHAVGQLFPRGARSPAIAPISERAVARRFADAPELSGFSLQSRRRVSRGFYISQAFEARRA